MSEEMMISGKEPAESDTYHDQKTMMRISVYASRLSMLFLALFLLVGAVIALFIWWYISGRFALEIFIAYMMYALGPFFLSGFFWIALQFISEGIYLLLDIEDNTRSAKKAPAIQ
jgi:NADH:ubiquinone oxidoreductase subunit 5 (subunit L)/multisubunit Na+/H+ antiporter MnhA subunit